MQRGRFIFTAALAFATASAQAATLVNSDFTLQDSARPVNVWSTNGDAGLDINPSVGGVPIVLKLTDNLNDQTGTVWTLQEFEVPSFTMWADVNVDFTREFPANCPADGFAMAFAAVKADARGGGGGSLGLYGSEEVLPRFFAMELNTWREQGLEDTDQCESGKFTTFAFSNNSVDTGVGREIGAPDTGGAKVGQTTSAVKIVNGGWYRYQWNVDSATGTMTINITGLDEGNKAVQNQEMAKVTFTGTAPKLGFKGRFGLTAATGGAAQGTYIRSVRVDSPMVPASAEPPAVVPPTAGN
jgi:hypothetical protein